MKSFYIKQKVVSLNAQYQIFDQEAKPLYYCVGAFLSMGHHLDFYRLKDDKLLYQLKRRPFGLLAKYSITDSDSEPLASVWRVLGNRFNQIIVTSKYGKMTIFGDFLVHNFTIANASNQTIATVHKQWFSIGDSYEITIEDGNHIPFILALAVLIDNCYHNGLGMGTLIN